MMDVNMSVRVKMEVQECTSVHQSKYGNLQVYFKESILMYKCTSK